MDATNPSPFGEAVPVTSVSTSDLAAAPPPSPDELYPEGGPNPTGTMPAAEQRAQDGSNTDPTEGSGVEGELLIWEARYSMRNFIGRGLIVAVLAVGWIVLTSRTSGPNGVGMSKLSIVAGIPLAACLLLLGLRMIQARYSHYYKLTTRRLFVSTGIIHRRRDMMELLRVKDVFTRQVSMLDRLLGLGTVVVVSNEKDLPTFYIAGVDDPKRVMDLIWHHARSERDQRSVKVDQV